MGNAIWSECDPFEGTIDYDYLIDGELIAWIFKPDTPKRYLVHTSYTARLSHPHFCAIDNKVFPSLAAAKLAVEMAL